MIIMAEKGEYYCALLETQDFEAFAAARTLCWQDKHDNPGPDTDPSYAQKVLECINKSGKKYWKGVFQNNCENFVLYKKAVCGNPDEIIGITDIDFIEKDGIINAWFSSSHILAPIRRQNLSALLYQARFKYIEQCNEFSIVSLCIKPDNIASIKAAQRNGFNIIHQEIDKDNKPRLILTRAVRLPDPRQLMVFDLGEGPS